MDDRDTMRLLQETDNHLVTAQDQLTQLKGKLGEAQQIATKIDHAQRNARQLLRTGMDFLTHRPTVYGMALIVLIFSFCHFGHGFVPKSRYAPAPAPPAEFRFDDELQKGMEAQRRLDHPNAIKHFGAALDIRPTSTTAITELAFSHFNMGQEDETMAYCNRLLGLNSNSARAYFLKGLVYKKQKRLQPALESFKLAAQYGDPQAFRQIRIVENLIEKN